MNKYKKTKTKKYLYPVFAYCTQNQKQNSERRLGGVCVAGGGENILTTMAKQVIGTR